MIAVIFELEPIDQFKQDYFDIAASMRSLLDEIDGFISVERFQSLTNPDKFLSLSFFDSEDALTQWRNLTQHRDAQRSGRERIFKDYHLRIAHVTRDYGMFDRAQAPQDSQLIHSDQDLNPSSFSDSAK